MNIFFTILYQPLYNLLVGFVDIFPWGGLGLAIILVTIIVKVVVLPLTYKSLKSQKELQEIQPRINEIRTLYKDDKERQAKELMAAYKHHNVNPFASCLPTIVQLVVFVVFYRVLTAGLGTVHAEYLYSFIGNPGSIAHFFLWTDLTHVSIPFAVVAAIAAYFQARQMVTRRPPAAARESSGALDEDMAATMNKTTLYALPIVTLVIGVTTLPAGLTLYMFLSTALTWLTYRYFLGPKKVTVIDVESVQ